MNSGDQRTWTSLLPEVKNFNVADLSLLKEFWGNNDAHVILTAEADSLSTDAEELLEDYGDATQEVMTGQFMQEMIPQGQLAFREKRMKKTTKIQMQQSLR